MKPLVFLDIDGVLHTLADRPMVLNADCVRALNWLTDVADAQIVVSSTWRFLKDIMIRLRNGGVRAKVIGTTPDLDIPWPAPKRGKEIARWLEIHSHRAFVILDDEDDMGDLLPYLVQSDFTHGLTMPLAELALGVLTRVHA